MKKIIPILIIIILAAAAAIAGYFIFGKKPPAPSPTGQEAEKGAVQIPGIDANDYLDEALKDLEAVAGLE